ncbi:S66 peptidase family protein [Streptomyces tsukubensis]|uniref:LD-carboxypeptidase n=1 Tax=Streptomyces tsukubensis TaxID=83656 RepID=A0A1V4ACU6_9ACTN|nr:LD-carboxypeptidase [Streptomyces tsukubensis]OON81747.1 LD-carboxypeptidase [Streptomyces tsukubensis]QFR96524.1 LD-carboxypeptidase [Streptomyces tsukubensis]
MTLTPLSRPAGLWPGARVAVVAPSGPVPEENLEAGLDILRGWGLDPVVGPHVLDRHPRFGYLAGDDHARAGDLLGAWCDPSVAGVLCARGGYGAQRMVDLLDWDAIRAAGPKVFVGYSDITPLHEAFARRAGFGTLHGPMVASNAFLKDPESREHLRATLLQPETVRVITSASAGAAPALGHEPVRGVTFGGCVSLLAAGLATPDARTTGEGGLLVIEDIGEEPYRLDRILTQLLRSGVLEGITGVVLGSWEECGPYEEVRAVLFDRLGGLGVPVAEQFGFGHCAGARTIPLGVEAELDADAGTLTLPGPALGPLPETAPGPPPAPV